MVRPTFSPDDAQREVLDALARVATAQAKLTEEADKLIRAADQLDIPVSHIAQHANVTRKTVYRHLGKTMK